MNDGVNECGNRATTDLPMNVKMATKSSSIFERRTWGTEGVGFGDGFYSLVVWSLLNGRVLQALEREGLCCLETGSDTGDP